MLATPAEQAGGLDAEVADLLNATVKQAGLEGLFGDVADRLGLLLLRSCHLLLLRLLRLKVGKDGREVAVIERGDLGAVRLQSGTV